MKLSDIGEFGLISLIESGISAPQGVTGIGDDCAVIPQTAGMDTLVSTDMLMEGDHFLLDDISAYELGWKSAAVNISDIAAMGGQPSATFLAFALPVTLDSGWVGEFMRGYSGLSGKFGVPLLGGDTTSSPDRLCVCVTVLGQAAHGKAKLRSSARPGDLICVTGPLGDSALGLELVLERRRNSGPVLSAEEELLVSRHYRPVPRVSEGMALCACDGVHAMMDISDGLVSDLPHILEASGGLGAEVDCAVIPLSPALLQVCTRRGLDPQRYAAAGGEDYELLFTMAPDTLCPVPHSVIGRVTRGGGLRFLNARTEFRAFRHF